MTIGKTDDDGIFTVRDAVIDLMRRLGMTSVFLTRGSTEAPIVPLLSCRFPLRLGLSLRLPRDAHDVSSR